MKSMTKRDIADIALVILMLNFILRLLNSIMNLIFMVLTVCYDPIVTNYRPQNLIILNIIKPAFLIAITAVLIWVLIYQRKRILDCFFPDSDQFSVDLSFELKSFTEYSFWVKLIGIVCFLVSLIEDLPALIGYISMFFYQFSSKNPPANVVFHYGFFSIIISLLVIWKADWIGEVLGRLGKNKSDKETGHPEES
jgi:hypothetical protein